MFSKDTLLWKLEMLKSAIASVNSHIYSVKAETLILPRSNNFLCFRNYESLLLFSKRCYSLEHKCNVIMTISVDVINGCLMRKTLSDTRERCQIVLYVGLMTMDSFLFW